MAAVLTTAPVLLTLPFIGRTIDRVHALIALVVALGAPAHLIRLDRGIGPLQLDMSPLQVRSSLGTPTHVAYGKWRVGFIARTYVYARRGLTVAFLRGGDGLYAYTIATTDTADRTATGVGVGSTEAEVKTRVPHVRCHGDRYSDRFCTRPDEAGAGGTTFTIRRGVVVRVQVFDPVF